MNSSIFIHTQRGMVNLAHVAYAFDNTAGDVILRDANDQTLGIAVALDPLERAVIQLIAPAEPYEFLTLIADDGAPLIISETVIAWALTATGAIYPITPGLMCVPLGETYGLRRRGQSQIELPEDASYDDEAAWIADHLKRAKMREEYQAKKAAMPKDGAA